MLFLNKSYLAFLLFSVSAFQLAFATPEECEVPDFETEFEMVNVVFTGKVVLVATNWVSGGAKATFEIDQSWKRSIERFTAVQTDMGNCQFQFEVGEEYLVYVYKEFTLKTGCCSRTTLLSKAQSDLALLGEGIAPGSSPGIKVAEITIMIMVLLGMVFLAFVVLRKRKQT